MFVMTAKVDKKKILIALVAGVLVILGLTTLLGAEDQPTAPSLGDNDARVKFLTDHGWEVAASPVEAGQVRIPSQSNDVLDRYNALQKSQGYDLTPCAGKLVMRYVYKVKNYPGATEPVYATLLVYKGQLMGGDITDTSPNGVMRGFRMPQSLPEGTTSGETVPSTT